jgi:hypothetical protein
MPQLTQLNIDDLAEYGAKTLYTVVLELLEGRIASEDAYIETALSECCPDLVARIDDLTDEQAIALAEQVCRLIRLRMDVAPKAAKGYMHPTEGWQTS